MPQSLSAVYLHLVFSTKDRRPWGWLGPLCGIGPARPRGIGPDRVVGACHSAAARGAVFLNATYSARFSATRARIFAPELRISSISFAVRASGIALRKLGRAWARCHQAWTFGRSAVQTGSSVR